VYLSFENLLDCVFNGFDYEGLSLSRCRRER